MPRRKPDEIIEHRLAFGPWERERLDLLVAGNVFNKVANPLVNLLSDVTGLAAFVGILEAVGVINIRKYIKDNTPLDEWANSVAAGLFSGFDEAMLTLDEAFAQTRALIEDIEGIEIPIPDIPEFLTGGSDENGTPFGLPTGEEFGRYIFGFPSGFVEGAVSQSLSDAKRYALMGLPDKTALRVWAWGKTTLQEQRYEPPTSYGGVPLEERRRRGY